MSPENIIERNKKSETIQVVRAVITTNDGRVCIGKRSPGYEGDKWCLVGGVAETPDLEHELYREISEELGVSEQDLATNPPIFISRVDRYKHGKWWGNNYYILLIANSVREQALLNFARDEFSEILFVEEKDLRGLQFAFGDEKIIKKYFKGTKNNKIF